MRSAVLVSALVAASLLVACDDKPATPAGGTPTTTPTPGSTPAQDLSTPLSAAKAFFAAGAASNKDALKGMVHPDARDSMLKNMREGTVSDKDLAEFKAMAASAAPGDVTEEGDTARVKVKATMPEGRGDSFTLRLSKKDGKWLVMNW